jgi:hypothetical protein
MEYDKWIVVDGTGLRSLQQVLPIFCGFKDRTRVERIDQFVPPAIMLRHQVYQSLFRRGAIGNDAVAVHIIFKIEDDGLVPPIGPDAE